MIAVTGANGLLGSFIVRRLIDAGEAVVALKRKDSDVSLLGDISKGITWRDADVTDPESLHEAFKDCKAVIHAAAIVSFNPRHKDRIYHVNVEGTRNVVNVCLELGITRLVHISSVAALGRQKGQEHIDEQNKWAESPINSTYGKSKYLAELEVFRGQEEGLSTVIINPSVILAPANWNKSSAQLFNYVWKERSFYISGSLNYVDVRDVANAVYKLLHSNIKGQRFIVNAGTISYGDFFQAIAKKLNKKAPSINVPKRLLRIVAVFENMRSWMGNSEPLLTRETARLAGMHFVYHNQKIIKTLNFEFQSIDRSLEWCCEYYMTKFSSKN